MLNYKRYKRVPVVDLPDRKWPNREIKKAPIWCSVDLRDGNQALIEPMVVEEKIEFFNLLVKLGFKEIEIGFPSASQLEYDFLRQLVERNMIPDDVTVQVLTQCREHLIERTFESLKGIKRAIVHIYNSTSTLQRDVVFHMSQKEIKEIAIEGTKMVKKYMKDYPGEVILEYSPESFTGTELPYALEVCEAVLDEWGATKEKPVIINLPSTVEMTTPNVYADQIEWMVRNFSDRERVIVSIPQFNLENVNEIIDVWERCNKMQLDMRHPYAGKLVFTAFSGSHQDAINKGVHAMAERHQDYWEVPYLPIDPSDVGREYEPIVRINSQSGKGGVAFVMDTYFGFKLPKGMHKEFADIIQPISERQGEVAPEQIMKEFKEHYIDRKEPYHFRKLKMEDLSDEIEDEFDTKVHVVYTKNGDERSFDSEGNGPIDAVQRGFQEILKKPIKILDYSEHALQQGSNAQAAAYIHLQDEQTGTVTYGVGISSNITRASIRALFSAVNRMLD